MTDEEVQAEKDRNDQILASMRADGVSTEEPTQVDYFGFDETHTVRLPDGKSFIVHKELNEGARKDYLNKQNREITVERVTQNMKLKVESGEERFQLLMAAIIDWNLVRKHSKTGETVPVPCNEQTKRDFLKAASPKVVDIIDKAVREANPWLNQELTLEDIDKQMSDLQDLRDRKVKDDAAKNS
jgi:hypothetical protein